MSEKTLQPTHAVQLFETQQFTADELRQIEARIGQQGMLYLDEQKKDIGAYTTCIENAESQLQEEMRKLKRTPEWRAVAELRQDIKRMRDRRRSIYHKMLGVIEQALRSVRKTDKMYKKILMLTANLRTSEDGGVQ